MKSHSRKVLNILRNKIHPYNPNHVSPNFWVINGTPTEILILLDDFKVQHDLTKGQISRIRNMKSKGKQNSEWFFFNCKPEIIGW